MRKNLTQSIEDYLKAIFEIAGESGKASTTKLAEMLEITPASVTGMIKKLSDTNPPLVLYQKHHGVSLTEDGLKIALETLRHHRLIELYLHQILAYPWDEVHDEADRLEHVISEKFEDKISKALGNPNHDPHGDPIPRKDLSLPKTSGTKLSDLRPTQTATIKRVRDTDPDLLRHLSEIGLTPESKISIIKFSEFDGNIHLKVEGHKEILVLGPRVTKQIYVESEKV